MKPQSWIILCSVTAGVIVSSCAVSFPEFQPTQGTGGTSSSTTASGTGGVGPGTGGTTTTPGSTGGSEPGTGGSGPGSGGGGVVANCTDYCNTITNNCTQENKEYVTNDTCLAMCKDMVPGHVGDTSGDTVGCRFTQAKSAAGNDANQVKYCQLAGPVGGDGACSGDPCGSWCDEVDTTCGEDSPWPGDIHGCKVACQKWAYLLTRDPGTKSDAGAGIGDLYQASGSLNCRIYHLEAANNVQDPMTTMQHCKFHLPSGGPCGP